MKQQYKNILVTGGSGFLATHLMPELVKGGYRVTTIDIYKSNVKNVRFIEADFNNTSVMRPLLEETDVIFHLAAMVGVDECRLNPEQVMKTNYEDSKNFIDLCVKTNVKKFMFTSSSEVYGNSPNIPYGEDDKLEPISIYAKTKVLIEEYLKNISDKNSMKIGIVRLFNVYGPYQKKRFIVPIFVDLALHSKNLTLFGSGKQIRCFTYVKDVVKGIIKLLEYDKSNYEIVNIGRRYETTIRKLALLILKCIPSSKSSLKHKQYGKDGIREANLEIMRRVPSIEKAKNLLGFEARTTLEEGINAMIAVA